MSSLSLESKLHMMACLSLESKASQEALEKLALADCKGRRTGQRVACLHTRYKGLDRRAWCCSCKAHWQKASPHWTEL